MADKKKSQKPKNDFRRQKEWRAGILYFLIALAIVSVVTSYVSGPKGPEVIDFSQFLNRVNKGQIQEVSIRTSDKAIIGKTSDKKEFKTYYVDYPKFVEELRSQNVTIKVNPTDSGWMWGVFLQAFLPFILIALLWFFIFRQAQGANNQALSFGKSRAVPWKKDDGQTRVTFKDVAGVDEAEVELNEIVDFLKNPEKYKRLGAAIPKGALLMGPPGTGKTLLAKAIAGEADVPFFSLSGSDFVEMFVGVGASRVRDLFNQAKKQQPCIIFLDEIDAVGRHRGAGLGGGHDEREQTLNQLLVEMDGFGESMTVIVIAATNRPDILDPALLRPGRFDRQIVVDKPDLKGREDILKIHTKKKKMSKDVDLAVIARQTPGFTGADLANLVNEGALLSARRGDKTVRMSALQESIERVIAGPERKSRIMSEVEKKKTAYHEVGHALVASQLPNTDPVHKISILPRGMALGYTLQLPVQDKFMITRNELKARIQILLGGRIAEELIFDELSSGASDDLKKVTEIAQSYVCKYGMSHKLGNRQFGKEHSQVFLGKDYADHSRDYSDDTARLIDEEIKNLVDDCYASAKTILIENKEDLENITQVLIEKEVIDGPEFEKLLSNKRGVAQVVAH